MVKAYTEEELFNFLKGYKRESLGTVWVIEEKDEGGMLGGGGPNYLDKEGKYFVYNLSDAMHWNSKKEVEDSKYWKDRYCAFPYIYNIAEHKVLYHYPEFSPKEIRDLIIDLIAHKQLLKSRFYND